MMQQLFIVRHCLTRSFPSSFQDKEEAEGLTEQVQRVQITQIDSGLFHIKSVSHFACFSSTSLFTVLDKNVDSTSQISLLTVG